jgi:hypothetical protein
MLTLTARDIPPTAFAGLPAIPLLSWHYADDGHIHATWPECIDADTDTWVTRSAVFHGDSAEPLRLLGDAMDEETLAEFAGDVKRGERFESTKWRA